MVELLSPAKDFTCLVAALENGADSVYIGVEECNMRANIPGFTLEDIAKATQITHEYESKLYLCTNTILKDTDIAKLENNLPYYEEYEVDALILSDLGLLNSTKNYKFDTHLSIQENITNTPTLKILQKLGITRAVLSRELNLEEIQKINTHTPIETEIFIHGALCTAISGRCYLSSYLYGKSANCGECLQPCRKKWQLTSQDNEKLTLTTTPHTNNNNLTYLLSPKDLCMIEYIPELIQTKTHAFKIEGRARPAEYVATTTKIYKQAIQQYTTNPEEYTTKPEWITELKKVFNRGFDQGFYFNKPTENSPQNQSQLIKKDIGQVTNYYNKIQVAEIKIWDTLKTGDTILIQGPTTGSIQHTITSIQINKKNINKAEKNQNIGIKIPYKIRPHDNVYKLNKRQNIREQ